MSARPATTAGPVLLQSYLDRLLAEVPAAHPPPVPTLPPVATQEAAPSASDIGGEALRPARRESPFPALLFGVHDVRFAAALEDLHGVVPWSDALSPLPETPDWFLGVCPYRDQNVRVVDTAGLIMQGQKLDVKTRPRHVILLAAGRWGLACDTVSEVMTVHPDAVQWRVRRGQRPWLAGTLREELCALLEIDALAAILERDSGGVAS